MAEGLAVANYNAFEDTDQQVFGICVRHRYFTFWSGFFPAVYLDTVRKDPNKLADASHYAIMKCYPASNFGLDFCDPNDREIIFRAIMRIKKYANKDYAV
eukprot:TRINITY_DN18603_c0_g1_i1.p1 TRINITY_DN18603_c0_g1~~TRINITY_DN18603_c0_g1_i1.p1  ORF type:complete len:100 (-),score=11.42 TRINITY_DN18603_c0_g1_i1:70-369(-)